MFQTCKQIFLDKNDPILIAQIRHSSRAPNRNIFYGSSQQQHFSCLENSDLLIPWRNGILFILSTNDYFPPTTCLKILRHVYLFIITKRRIEKMYFPIRTNFFWIWRKNARKYSKFLWAIRNCFYLR